MRRGWLRIISIASLCLAAGSALAQPAPLPEPDGNKELAKEWANKGNELFQAGDYQGAIDAMHEAEKHARPPTFTRLLAQANDKLGKLVEAQRLYQSIVGLNLVPGTPTAWIKAQEEAKNELATLTPRIPKLEISVTGVEPSALKVTLDGTVVEWARLDTPFSIDPGKHVIIAEAGGRKVQKDIELQEAKSYTIKLEIPPAPPPAITATATAAPTVPTASPQSVASAGSGSIGPYVVLGVSGAVLLVGAITGGMTLAKGSDLRKYCGDNLVCPEEDRVMLDIEGAKSIGYVSTAAFALAGAGAAIGTIWLLWPSKKTDPKGLGIAAGPGFVSVKGTF